MTTHSFLQSHEIGSIKGMTYCSLYMSLWESECISLCIEAHIVLCKHPGAYIITVCAGEGKSPGVG